MIELSWISLGALLISFFTIGFNVCNMLLERRQKKVLQDLEDRVAKLR